MIDIFMLIMIIVLSIILLVISLYLLVYYCHPDDSGLGSGLICKIFAILALTIAWAQVLLLPLDVSNTRGEGGGFRMDIIWQLVYIIIGIFVIIIIPFLISVYEVNPEWTCCQKITNGFCFFSCELIVMCGLLALCFLTLHTAEVPIKSITCSIENSTSSNSAEIAISGCKEKATTIELDVGFQIVAIALLSFISYFLFVIFGGVGIFALPLDLLYSFCTRPKKIEGHKLEQMKNTIVETAMDLKDLGLKLKKMENEGVSGKSIFSSDKRKYNSMLNELKVGVTVIDDEFELVNIQNMINGTSIIGYYCNMIIGVFFMIISVIWVLHIFIYVIIRPNGKPLYSGINILLVFLTEKNVSFVAIGIFAILCVYLLLATVKGNFKFGIRMLCLGSIHPMKKNETYMNSILFNIMLVMITSVSVVHFCVKAFNEYAAMTDIDIIFSTQIQYMKFFVFFFKYNIFEYLLLVVIIVSFIYLLCRPKDSNTMRKILYKKLEEDKKAKETQEERFIEMTEKKSEPIP